MKGLKNYICCDINKVIKKSYKWGNIIIKIKCLICGDIIESKRMHDLVSCKCESCYIDGSHIGAKHFCKIVKILDDGTEVKDDDWY